MMRFDLHIHSCLSPCGSLEMSPRVIAETARRRGLDAIAVVDHNSGLNAPAVRQCCRNAGVKALYGIEATTVEESHVLCIFDRPETALRVSRAWFRHLPPRAHDPRRFGDQVVVNAAEEIEAFVSRSLVNALDLPLAVLARQVRAWDGLLIAAHVDRSRNSLYSQLGLIPPGLDLDAVEVGAACEDARARRLSGPFPWIRSSDAHAPDQIGDCWNCCDLIEFSVSELRKALRAGKVRPVGATRTNRPGDRNVEPPS